ncbi:Similar to Putative ATP-dependent RNA helicase R290; acc. no. Q5UPX0 [Pyronema omphalodes CBS 100304]|uniref:Similar to Putative ATP-dependent RNA helicase R290 acc. no. Q5UPX0 n=1 Tax=Pyronema omphalodes (strain CBS 100304) TaxID=1076935 RepID=U4KWP5_PYROM|nr:Similar to Putative ATP-dependent RNA helicase R290; acc. no. Q5UPX0 [Pyronema omphalodes CBS 100304]
MLPTRMHTRPQKPDDPVYGTETRSPAEICIAMFYANYSQARKAVVHDQFPQCEIRILVATDVYGVGVNIPRVRRVIQWGLQGCWCGVPRAAIYRDPAIFLRRVL